MGIREVKTSKVAVGKWNMEDITPITETLAMDTQPHKLKDMPNSLSFLAVAQYAKYCKMTHNIQKAIMMKKTSAYGFREGISRRKMKKKGKVRNTYQFLPLFIKYGKLIQDVVTDVDFNTVSVHICIV
ncbi:hypothetical protein DUI87_22728 [Hirundo rustica rustica]|uniref:Uncharacterized protein n=1 Tax=Hirundo rustica rustica TaxID=333673 RepID=A0A3M0JK73_HIRRU|nr:hypothetical protein DUI87_22728 [Hirundo rustica rustica]